MTARKDFLRSLTLGKKSEPTAEYPPSLRFPWRASFDLLAEPVNNRLFFAGEATHREFYATVHGAYETGVRAAEEVLQALK